MNLENIPWFNWLEEFPWCSAILKYIGRSSTQQTKCTFATLGDFSSPFNKNKMFSTNKVNHLFRLLMN
jgi:hypothetical protein